MALSPEDRKMFLESGLIDPKAEARYEALKARMAARAKRQASRARKPAPARETQLPSSVEKLVEEALLRRRIDQAIRETLALPVVAEALDQLAPAAVPVPDKPLHEMTAEEWDAHRRTYWEAAMPARGRTLTISDLVGEPSQRFEA